MGFEGGLLCLYQVWFLVHQDQGEGLVAVWLTFSKIIENIARKSTVTGPDFHKGKVTRAVERLPHGSNLTGQDSTEGCMHGDTGIKIPGCPYFTAGGGVVSLPRLI
jgi:hypothetical protein